MRANMREILDRAIGNGLARGWQRAHKHVDDPTPSHIMEEVLAAIWLEIDEVVIFEEWEP